MDLKKIVFAACFLFLNLISFGVKLIEFDNPFSGFHQLRQLDNLLAIENYFLEGIELKRRTVSGGYIVYELPVYQALVAYLSSSLDDVLFFARCVNLVFAFLSMKQSKQSYIFNKLAKLIKCEYNNNIER